MPERIAILDCFSGASGDMLLGALVDAGLPLEALSGEIERLPCGPIRLRAEKVMRAGLQATQVHVEAPHEHAHRGLGDITTIIRGADLPERVKERAIAVFTRLGEAEAAVHGCPIDHIHFHEVGALDAIADIVGAAVGLEHLGIDRLLFGTLHLGGGTIRAAHGTLPVPAPATARLVKGLRCEMGPVEMELLTPTAAAILTALGKQEDAGEFTPESIGYGAGSRDIPHHPNVLRLTLGRAQASEEADRVWVLEANLDDTTAEVCGYAIERLLAAGALDAWASPIQMKKSRPGWMLCAIAEPAALRAVEEIFFLETTTFGVRRHLCERSKLAREMKTVETAYGPVRVKVGSRAGKVITASPEFEDCRRVAEEKGVAVRVVMGAALRAGL